ncbi:protein MOS2-like [Lolium rigidum]|uniref:protein MOS2-like n=1 Tax=Lolium rigidum TaxID=89674 RepID=UPI001F5D3B89|nr:protein MOS2-like [Lolium rigidum]
MEEKKLSFSIAPKPRPPKPPSSATKGNSASASATAAPAQQFVTEFDPSQTLAAGAAPAVIAPLANSGHFLNHRSRKPSSLPTPEEEAALAASTAGGPTFVLDTSTNPDNPSSHIGYGLTLRSGDADAESGKPSAAEPEKKPPSPARDGSSGDLMLRRYKEDMASLPDHRGIDEFEEVPVEGFGAALLAGYGWSQGKGVGRNNKGDCKVVEYQRRAGTLGLGYDPSEADPKKTRSGEWVIGGKKGAENGNGKKAADNGSAKKRDRDREDRAGERDSSTRQKRSGDHRTEREVKEKDRNARDSREGERSRDVTNKVRWLQSNIRVRVVTKRLSKRLYLQKGRIVDVVGPTTCDIRMDEGSELVQGVEQDMLETVLPRTSGRVLVLSGKHKGVYGHLVEKNAEAETGLVEDADTKGMVRVNYDQIAEYVGDPELLGH